MRHLFPVLLLVLVASVGLTPISVARPVSDEVAYARPVSDRAPAVDALTQVQTHRASPAPLVSSALTRHAEAATPTAADMDLYTSDEPVYEQATPRTGIGLTSFGTSRQPSPRTGIGLMPAREGPGDVPNVVLRC